MAGSRELTAHSHRWPTHAANDTIAVAKAAANIEAGGPETEASPHRARGNKEDVVLDLVFRPPIPYIIIS